MSFADIFVTEEFAGHSEENSDSAGPQPQVQIVIEEADEPQQVLDDSSESVTEPENSSDMTLKQGDSDSDQFAVDGLLVNPDDLLPPVVKLEKYAESEISFNRQVVVRNLLETLRVVQGDQEHVSRVVIVMMTLSEDYDPIVRSELMGQFPHIAAFFKEKGPSINIRYNLWPILISYLGTDNSQVRKASHTTLLSVVEQRLIDLETVTEKICPLVVHLTDSVHPEELRTDSILLMSKLAVLLGKKITEELFLPCIFSLCVDTGTSVRKACASAFGDICTTVGRETTEESLLPKFIELCEDNAWGVRKACAENFMAVSCVVSRETRCNELAEIYMVLLKDQSRWVRITAYQGLGPFISTFAEPDKTGLYYSKDGVLTIIDIPESSNDVEHSSNEQYRDNNCKNCEKPDKGVERTNSDTCDSIVPLSSTENPLSALEIPGISCHVGNYCTVIEVSCSDATSVEDAINDVPKLNGRLCFADDDSVETQQLSDSFTCENSGMNKLIKTSTSDLNSELDSNDVNVTKCLKEIGECGENVKYLSKLEYNSSDSVPLVNGDIGELSNENVEDCLSFECENVVTSKEMSALLNSVTVNGVHVNPPETITESLNCETTNSVSTNLKTNTSTDMVESLEFESRESTRWKVELNESSGTISDDEENVILLNGPGSSSVDPCSETDVKLVEKNPDESAFNHFQYWRLPLEDIDISNAIDLCVFGNEICRNKTIQQPSCESINVKYFRRGFYFRDPDVYNLKDEDYDGISENKEGEPPPGEDAVSAFDQDIVPAKLLRGYLTMIDTAWTEVAHHCAYSLPAVAFTLGRKYWPCLKETFNALSSDLQGFIMMWKVRRTVASSMHQLAVILGPDITSKDLLPVFSRFIYDLDEVRIGILQHISEFLKVLCPEERKRFLPCLSEFLKSNSNSESNEKNWRFRLILAEQLVPVADLYEPQDVKEHLVPLSLTLIQDKICEVRLAAVRVMAAVMRRMSQHPTPDLTKAVLSELTEKFIHSPKWIHRQLYVYVCQEFIVESSLPPDQFAEDALPQLLYLCWDRVANIRIAIARCLAVVIWPLETFSGSESPHRELLLQTIHTLQSDCDVDVQFYANMVSTLECSCLVHEEFTNLPV